MLVIAIDQLIFEAMALVKIFELSKVYVYVWQIAVSLTLNESGWTGAFVESWVTMHGYAGSFF